jgi:hypothetical protein
LRADSSSPAAGAAAFFLESDLLPMRSSKSERHAISKPHLRLPKIIAAKRQLHRL